MRLLIDIGNSHIVVATHNGDIHDVYRINTNKHYTSYEYSVFLNPILSEKNFEGIIISSVVPEVTLPIVNYCKDHLNIVPIVVGPGVKTGINIKTDNPKEVGSDIIAAAVAATQYEKVLVVDLGTATTFTFIEKNMIKGVTITTGLKTAMKALIDNTSLLHEINLEPARNNIGTNTTESLKIGLVNGHGYMVDAFIKRIADKDTKVLLTGGFAELVNKILNNKYEVSPNLLLEGLNKIYLRNRR